MADPSDKHHNQKDQRNEKAEAKHRSTNFLPPSGVKIHSTTRCSSIYDDCLLNCLKREIGRIFAFDSQRANAVL